MCSEVHIPFIYAYLLKSAIEPFNIGVNILVETVAWCQGLAFGIE
jgi:hypothetical protein